MILTLFVSMALTLVIGIYTVEKLKKKKIEQSERHDGPQSHLIKEGTPTSGGIMCIVTAIILGVVYYVFPLGIPIEQKGIFITLIICSVIFGLVGFLDDSLKVYKKNTDGLSPKKKMILLTLVGIVTMSVLIFALKMKSAVYIYFLESVSIAGILKVIIDVVVLIATTNAVNLTDGVAGLSSSVGIVILTFLMGYAIKTGNLAVAIFDIIVIGSYIIFLLFNWHKAKVFMGDTGSFFLGAVIALSAIATGLEFVLPIIAIIPVVEALSVILQVLYYKKTKKRLFKMAPIHHHFEQLGWKEVKVVKVFAGITILMCIIAKFIIN